MCYCYLHIFPNSKIYVGTTQKEKVEDRWKKDGYGYHHQQFIWNAICKYGWENVKHKVIVCETPEEMWEMEKKLIKEYDTTNPEHGYNISIGGEKSAFGNCLTEDTRRKMSETRKGKKRNPHTEEVRRKISETKKNTPKPKWLTPDGEIRIMDKANVTHYHKDWILIQNQE